MSHSKTNSGGWPVGSKMYHPIRPLFWEMREKEEQTEWMDWMAKLIRNAGQFV